MGCATDILLIAQGINHDFSIIDATETESNNTSTYDAVITNKALRRKTEKLFKDGHHARAVEEAYKLLDNTVKVKAGLQQTDLTGAKLMQTAFSPNKPLLRLNECVSTSEQNEQSGYMQILAGCMVGNNSRYALSCLIMLYYLTFHMKSKTFLPILLLSCFIL